MLLLLCSYYNNIIISLQFFYIIIILLLLCYFFLKKKDNQKKLKILALSWWKFRRVVANDTLKHPLIHIYVILPCSITPLLYLILFFLYIVLYFASFFIFLPPLFRRRPLVPCIFLFF